MQHGASGRAACPHVERALFLPLVPLAAVRCWHHLDARRCPANYSIDTRRAERGSSPVAARLSASASVLACGGVSLYATASQRVRWNTIQPRAVSW
jgi:hypothetical protein